MKILRNIFLALLLLPGLAFGADLSNYVEIGNWTSLNNTTEVGNATEIGPFASVTSLLYSFLGTLSAESETVQYEDATTETRATILQPVGVLSATSYATAQPGVNIGAGASSGYIEARFFNPQDGSTASTMGVMFLLSLGDIGANSRHFSLYIANAQLTLDVYDSGGGRRIVNYLSKIERGWHTVRVESDGATYTMTLDGSPVSLNVSLGSNDGLWTGDADTRIDGVTIGALRIASDSPSYNGTSNYGYISYVDLNGTSKWVFSDTNYVYDVIGGYHLTWTGAGDHIDYQDSTFNWMGYHGYSLWQKSGSDDIYVPFSSSDAALSLTPGTDIPSGYTKTRDVPGSTTVWNNATAEFDFRGVPQSSSVAYGINYAASGSLNTNSGTRTWFIQYSNNLVGSTGYLRKLRFYYGHSANTSSFKLQVWRLVSGTHTLVHNVDILGLLGSSTGIVEPVLSSPLFVQEGDFIALCVTNSTTDAVLLPASLGAVVGSTVYADEEKTTGYDWSSALDASTNLNVELFIDAPVLASIGDSIVAGHPGFWSIAEPSVGNYDRTNQIQYHLYETDNKLTFINFGFGGATLANKIQDLVDYAISVRPSFVLVNGGVNDVAGGETNNSTIVSNYEAIVDAINAENIPVIALSVFPYSNGSNAQGQQIDALNGLLETMMAGKDGIFVDCTETLGQFRAGGDPGNLWDLKTAYDADGVHLTPAGAEAAAGKIYADVSAAYTIPDNSNVEIFNRANTTIASLASWSASSYDAGNPFRFSVADLINSATLNSYFESDYQGKVTVTSDNDSLDKITVKE